MTLIANKPIDSMLRSYSNGAICKLDIKKAYNHVYWDFLLAILIRWFLVKKRIRRIKRYISTTNFSVLSHGTPFGFFQSSRGLRYGDPLSFSTYLFVVAMKTLNCLLKRSREGGFWSSFRVKGREGERIEVSHLFFVDDTLIFCEASQSQMV